MSKLKVWQKMVVRVPSPKGRALFLVGIMFICVGLSNVVTADEIYSGVPSFQAYAAQFAIVKGLEFWGMLFIVVGMQAVVSSFSGKHYFGFFALMLMSMWWSGLYVASLLMTGYTRIIPSIFTWGLISMFLYTISSWQEVEDEI